MTHTVWETIAKNLHGKSAWSNFGNQTNKENVNILKNGFYHRILQPSEYQKSEVSKKNFFFETLEDGPLCIMHLLKYIYILKLTR